MTNEATIFQGIDNSSTRDDSPRITYLFFPYADVKIKYLGTISQQIELTNWAIAEQINHHKSDQQADDN